MTQNIILQLTTFASFIIVLIIPGWALFNAVWHKKNTFHDIEKMVLSVAASIVAVDLLMLALDRFGIAITRWSLLLAIAAFSIICITISKFSKRAAAKKEGERVLYFTKKQTALILLGIFLSIFIKTIYLSTSVLPSSTDLGHHMYWANSIVQSHELPVYQERDIVSSNGTTHVSEPEPIADFIIGEHMIFAAISLISGTSVVSTVPMIILFVIHIIAILSIFIVSLRMFSTSKHAQTIAILALFFIGPLYSLSAAQAKFISGGVIGNTIGNLLIPVAIYCFVRALQSQSAWFLSSAIFFLLGLAYTHHLSTFVFIFVFIFSFLIYAFLNLPVLASRLRQWSKLIFSPQVLSAIALGIVFIFLIYMPTYLNTKAIDTAVGTPSKSTRVGLTLSQLKMNAGEARIAFGILGTGLLLLAAKRKTYGHAFAAGWSIALFIMSLRPGWLFIDIPSTRIANYIAFPMAIAGAYAFVWIFSYIRNSNIQYFKSLFVFPIFFLLLSYLATTGLRDNSVSLSDETNFKSTIQTFEASKYLASVTGPQDSILKDHNYIQADAWIKVFFMRDYNYPFSRAFFKRYDDPVKPREQCTLLMISAPNTEDGQKCFRETSVNYVMINQSMDSVQFEKSQNFSKIYSGDNIGIFYKNK